MVGFVSFLSFFSPSGECWAGPVFNGHPPALSALNLGPAVHASARAVRLARRVLSRHGSLAHRAGGRPCWHALG